MEPVTLEVKLTNTSVHGKTFATNPLAWSEDMIVMIQKDGERKGHRFWPYIRYCRMPRETKLELGPGKSLYGSLFVSAGVKRDGGWFISAPGTYTIRVGLHVNDMDIRSKPLVVQVMPRAGDAKRQKILQEVLLTSRIIAPTEAGFREGQGILEDAEGLQERRVATHAAWRWAMRGI
jgi:hypothetical protein